LRRPIEIATQSGHWAIDERDQVMRQIGKNVLLTVTVIAILIGIIGVFLAGSFFLQTRMDGLPVSEMFSKQNISNSLVVDVPVILVAMTLGIAFIWTGRKR